MMEVYELKEKIGQGQFSQVFSAVHKPTQTPVALKLVTKPPAHVPDSSDFISLETLKQEVKCQRGLRHENVLRLMACFETEKEIVFVTELCQGDLLQLLRKEGRFNEDRVRQVAQQMVIALHYIHERNIIHRDLKLQNILLGLDGRYKICDFGFSKRMQQKQFVMTSVKGTPIYMAPELIREEPYSNAVDIWALGIILFELYTGLPPFYTTNIFNLVSLILNQPIKWPSKISPGFKDLLSRLLEKDVSNRIGFPELLSHPFLQLDRSQILSVSQPTQNQTRADSAVDMATKKSMANSRPQNNHTFTLSVHNIRDSISNKVTNDYDDDQQEFSSQQKKNENISMGANNTAKDNKAATARRTTRQRDTRPPSRILSAKSEPRKLSLKELVAQPSLNWTQIIVHLSHDTEPIPIFSDSAVISSFTSRLIVSPSHGVDSLEPVACCVAYLNLLTSNHMDAIHVGYIQRSLKQILTWALSTLKQCFAVPLSQQEDISFTLNLLNHHKQLLFLFAKILSHFKLSTINDAQQWIPSLYSQHLLSPMVKAISREVFVDGFRSLCELTKLVLGMFLELPEYERSMFSQDIVDLDLASTVFHHAIYKRLDKTNEEDKMKLRTSLKMVTVSLLSLCCYVSQNSTPSSRNIFSVKPQNDILYENICIVIDKMGYSEKAFLLESIRDMVYEEAGMQTFCMLVLSLENLDRFLDVDRQLISDLISLCTKEEKNRSHTIGLLFRALGELCLSSKNLVEEDGFRSWVLDRMLSLKKSLENRVNNSRLHLATPSKVAVLNMQQQIDDKDSQHSKDILFYLAHICLSLESDSNDNSDTRLEDHTIPKTSSPILQELLKMLLPDLGLAYDMFLTHYPKLLASPSDYFKSDFAQEGYRNLMQLTRNPINKNLTRLEKRFLERYSRIQDPNLLFDAFVKTAIIFMYFFTDSLLRQNENKNDPVIESLFVWIMSSFSEVENGQVKLMIIGLLSHVSRSSMYAGLLEKNSHFLKSLSDLVLNKNNLEQISTFSHDDLNVLGHLNYLKKIVS